MILKHRDTSLVRFEWTSSEEVRVDFVDARLMRDAEPTSAMLLLLGLAAGRSSRTRSKGENDSN